MKTADLGLKIKDETESQFMKKSNNNRGLTVFALLSLLICGCDDFIKIGTQISPNELQSLGSYYSMISSAELTKLYSIKHNNILFNIAIDTADYKIKYIETRDTLFNTPEGLNISSKLSEIKATYNSELIKVPGWSYYLQLPSGWNAAFFIGDTGTDYVPKEDNKVDFYFMR